ncbi:MAG: dynamin family protein [Acidimicrobiales bacterium]
MTSELAELAAAASELARATGDRYAELASRASRLAERLGVGRFHVSVVGEFKVGKSTLVNALLGSDLLPTGVLPLTAVATEVSYGAPNATVVHLDGSREQVVPDQIAAFVTEQGNPANERKVDRVEVQLPTPLLEPGVVLVDTPGLGSIYQHNDTEARRALLDADGAILVLSADAPMSLQENELLALLAERTGPTFFVLNKIDHLRGPDRTAVARFVSEAVGEVLGRKAQIWCLSARDRLAAAGEQSGIPPGEAAGGSGEAEEQEEEEGCGLAGFLAAFARFVETDLVATRLRTARDELARLGQTVADAVSLDDAAMALSGEELEDRARQFRAEADIQRQAFEDERVLLGRDVAMLTGELGKRLAEYAAAAPAKWARTLDEVAHSAPIGRLEAELRDRVEAVVEESFEAFRQAESERVEASWEAIAGRFRASTEARVNRVRAVAGELFTVELSEVHVPEMSAEREQFFYLFIRVDPLGSELLRGLRRLLPPAAVRRHLLQRARAHLGAEFEKHSGRARWDLSQRLGGVRRRFEAAMSYELAAAVEGINEAAARAAELQKASETDRQRRRDGDELVLQAARRASSAGHGGG